jgi:hypothetical protein
MTTNALLVILSLLVAGGCFFQYYYKAKKQIETDFVLALRFISILCAAAYQSRNQ